MEQDAAEQEKGTAGEHKTFEEFLRKQQKLTENLIHFVVFAIAMVRPDVSPAEGLRETRYSRFVREEILACHTNYRFYAVVP